MHRKSNFVKWTIALSICGILVLSSDIWPANRLLEFVALLITLAVCILSFVLVFTNIRTALLGITFAAFCFSISYNHWPATTRFKMSKDELNRLLAAHQGSTKIETPIWCGSYYIKEITTRGDSTCFWTDLTPAGYTGLVYTPDGQTMRYFNIWKNIRLSSNWQIVSEDWLVAYALSAG